MKTSGGRLKWIITIRIILGFNRLLVVVIVTELLR